MVTGWWCSACLSNNWLEACKRQTLFISRLKHSNIITLSVPATSSFQHHCKQLCKEQMLSIVVVNPLCVQTDEIKALRVCLCWYKFISTGYWPKYINIAYVLHFMLTWEIAGPNWVFYNVSSLFRCAKETREQSMRWLHFHQRRSGKEETLSF